MTDLRKIQQVQVIAGEMVVIKSLYDKGLVSEEEWQKHLTNYKEIFD